MTSKPILPASLSLLAARVATAVLIAAAMACPGCSDSPSSTPPTGTSSGETVKPNVPTSKPAAKLEPL